MFSVYFLTCSNSPTPVRGGRRRRRKRRRAGCMQNAQHVAVILSLSVCYDLCSISLTGGEESCSRLISSQG